MIDAILGVLRFSAPVAFTAVGEAVGQKSGVINIGLEGLMLVAAYTSVEVAGRTGSPWVGLAAGVAAALVLNLIQAVFTLLLEGDQVVIGTAVNLAGLGLTSTLFQKQYGASGAILSVPKFPAVVAGLDAVLLTLPVLVIGLGWAMFRSKWGLALRAAGDAPHAVESAGYSVMALRWQGQAIVGTMVGLAGSYLTLGIAGSFAENMTAGRGFVAIAMVTFGRWKPVWVLGACLLVGAMEWMQFALQGGATGLPLQFFRALPYVVALGVLILVGKGTLAPLALGRPFRKEK